MTKITTDFVGSETIAVTKQRLTDILAYWGASTAAYTTWGQARTALNALLTSTTAGTIGSTELAGTFLPKINFLNDPDDMVLDALFGAGEQGVWLDPSDVANVAWRRNQLLWTEDFRNTAQAGGTRPWGQTGILAFGSGSVVNTTETLDPAGGNTADLLVMDGSTGPHSVGCDLGLSFSALRSNSSIYFKYKDWRYVALLGPDSGYAVVVDLVTGIATYSGIATSAVSVTPAANGWVRVSFNSTQARYYTFAFNNGTGFGYSFAGTSGAGVYVWGAQLELGTTATEYQPITDLNTEVLERFPNATMYQDAAGTTPVYAPGQPVGLRLDKSKGLVLGPELVLNGTFAGGTTTDWTATRGATLSVVSNALRVTQGAVSDYALASQAVSLTVGAWYRLTLNYLGGTASNVQVGIGVNNTSPDGTVIATPSSAQSITLNFLATAATMYVRASVNVSTDNVYADFDNFSLKALPGNHATQSTAGSRPMYGIEPKGGRRNLLTWSEDQTNAIWTKRSGATVTGTTVNFTSSASQIDEMVSRTIAAGQTFTISFEARAGTASTLNFTINGITNSNNNPAAVVQSLTSTWTRYSATFTTGGSDSGLYVIFGFGGTSQAVGTVEFRNAQFETGSTATAYQKVTTAFDVTEAGVNTCHYCEYDGINGGMITNSIDFTATDKMSMFAGVRKNSDAAVGVAAELSATIDTNAGSFVLAAPATVAANYFFASRGSVFVGGATTPTSYPAPITNVLTGIGDISGDISAIRANGVQVAQSTGDQGTGNFGNYKLNIGRRGNDQPTPTLPFKGRDYGIIVTGKLANATAIATTEMWLANKTAGVTL